MIKKILKNGWFVFGFIFIIFVLYFYVLGFNIQEVIHSNVGEKGTFGDSFGFLTALFSALAFGAFIITLWQQQEELELTREELKKSATALSKQSENLEKQNFENTFFNMLNLHNQIKNDISDIFINISIKLNERATQDSMGGTMKLPDNRTISKYLSFYKKNESTISHYYRNIYQMLKFVHFSDIENKKFYTNIFRAQFSTVELEFLFFHCLSNYGKDKFKPLLEEYEFLEPLFLDKNYLIEEISQYDIKVFGKNDDTLSVIEKLNNEVR